jgi:outer membrane receptor protein involved in Fe transport
MGTTQLTLDWQLGGFKLKSITAYETIDYTDSCGCDFTGGDIFIYSYTETYDQFSQELRLTSPVGDKFDYILGAHYQSSDHRFDDAITVYPTSVLILAINAAALGLGSAIAGTQASRLAKADAETLSAFAHANWCFADDWTLQLGGRITRDDKLGFRTLGVFAEGGGPLTPVQTLDYTTYFADGDFELNGILKVFYASEYLPDQTQDPLSEQEAFTRINARIGVGPADGKWEIALLAKNLSDEKVRTYNGDAPDALSSCGAKTNYTFYSQGRYSFYLIRH